MGMNKQRVLIAEDNSGIRKILTIEMKLKGYEAVAVKDGQEALNRIKSDLPDILLLDLNLPLVSGFEILEQLRKTSQIPVIVISAYVNLRQKALDLGANAFIPKPFNPEVVSQKIDELLL